MKAVEVVGLANMVSVLDVIVRTLLIVGLGNLYAAPSLMLLVKEFDPQNTVHSLLALVNVMTFWLLAVRAMGLARLTGVSFIKAALWVFGIWAAYTALLIGLASVAKVALKRCHRMRPPAGTAAHGRPAPETGSFCETKPVQPCLNN